MPQESIATVTREDMLLFHSQCDRYFASPESFPLSFTYDGAVCRGMPENTVATRRFLDANMLETVLSGTVGDLAIRVECVEYRDFPALEWTAYFGCAGNGSTGVLTDVWAADLHIAGQGGVLVHNNGDFYSPDGYTQDSTVLEDGVTFTQSPRGGRPCDQAFPYQRLLFDNFGVNIAIGWPGQWCCHYAGTPSGVTLRTGQQDVRTEIHAVETFRTPRMALVFFQGAGERGVNLWRRWFNAHVTPRRMGSIIRPAASFLETGGGIEHLAATEQNQLEAIDYLTAHVKGADVWWIDAGWYVAKNDQGEPEWPVTGTWIPDPERFPNGLGPIGKACEEAGLDLLVWFEPERVRPGTWLADQHPEWMLKTHAPSENMLLNLADPECLQWLYNTFSDLIRESGIRCYRQDFNFEPLDYWRDNEAENRLGMLENQYLQGYLQFWDTLLTTFPDLWIDSCSSGGRRNDLETMRRAVPLHPTDYGYGYHHINQAFRHTLLSWIPYTRGFCQSWDKDNRYYDHEDYYAADEPAIENFQLVNGFAAFSSVSTVRELMAVEDRIPYLNQMLEIRERFAWILLLGDFYPLTENHRDNTRWTIFQFHLPEHGEGAFQVLRNNQSHAESVTVFPRDLNPAADYLLHDPQNGERRRFTGDVAMTEGITFTQPVRSGTIWFYHEVARE